MGHGPVSPGDSQPRAEQVRAQVARALDALESVTGTDPHELSGQARVELLDQLEQVRRRVESLTCSVLASVETDGMWAIGGARSFATWWRHRSGRNRSTASREVAQARALRDHLPVTAAALAAGEISGDHSAAMARHTVDTPAKRERLHDEAVGEEALIDSAKRLDASRFAVLTRHWSHRADPEAADRAYVEDSDREEFYLAETTDGYVPGGWLSKTTGRTVLTALKARVGTPAADDRRTPGQRRAKALAGLAHLALDSGALKPGARIRPHLAVTVTYETLDGLISATAPAGGAPEPPAEGDGTDRPDGSRSGGASAEVPPDDGAAAIPDPSRVITADLDPAVLAGLEPAVYEDGTPLAPSELARIACSSQIHRVVFGPEREVLDVGREERLFTAAQTRAIVARDVHCQYPGCDAPPGDGEIHHSIWWWSQVGTTTVWLGVLLCWHHHDLVHQRHISIERRSGRWVFRRPDGTEIVAAELMA